MNAPQNVSDGADLSFAAALVESARATDRNHLPGRLLSALRGWAHPALMRQLHDLNYLGAFWPAQRRQDPLFFLTHRYYLAQPLRVRDRIECALYHYTREGQIFSEDYLARVYRSDGIVLWSAADDGHTVEIRLRATEDNRYEGDLSMLLTVDGALVCRMSYTAMDAARFGLAPGPTLFITRNQVYRGAELDLFRRMFKQNSPPYFCLAAIIGVAQAQKLTVLTAIRRQAQIAYEPRYEQGFQNSYCSLWESFGARDAGPMAYAMTVPPQPPPLSEVTPGHRGRAQRRRAKWAEVTNGACDALRDYLVEI